MTRKQAIDAIGAAREQKAPLEKAEREARKLVGELLPGDVLHGHEYIGTVESQDRADLSRARLDEVLGEKAAAALIEKCGTKAVIVLHVERKAVKLAAVA